MRIPKMELTVFIIVCGSLFSTMSVVMAIENNKTPLNVANPISGPTGENKDAKKAENRFDDPPPEYYK